MKRLITLVLCILFSLIIHAQTIQGIVKDAENGDALIGANVVIKGTTTGTVTDENGNFELKTNLKFPLTLTISYLGYLTQEFKVENSSGNITAKLKSDQTVLNEVEIIGSRLSEKQKESPLTVESMDLISVKETPSVNFYDGLGRLKGVDLTSASFGFKIINTRGFNSTSPVRSLQLIDGVDNQSPGLNFSLGNFLGTSELDVRNVDLIVGASSAFFGPNAFNGVINMTTKNPFDFPGLSVMVKVGERGMLENAIRFAQSFKNKMGEDKFAFKFNYYYLRANDWVANNLDSASGSLSGVDNPGRYDAVNRYGDENLTKSQNNASSLGQQVQFPGLGIWYRTGYLEKDLTNYNTRNLKLGASFDYRFKKNIDLIFASNFGTGTTVYQGDNRYSLNDILFFQNRLEIVKRDKFFLRAYATNENAGKSYDAVTTAFILESGAKSNGDWTTDYRTYWAKYIVPKVHELPGFPAVSIDYDFAQANKVLAEYHDSLVVWHTQAENYANNQSLSFNQSPYLVPGSAAFDSVFHKIISTPFNQGGTLFIDHSALYHIQGEYKFTPSWMNITIGGNFRQYVPNSGGTIFQDTGNRVIRNSEFGFYAGLEKRFIENKLKINATARLDKNENFDFLLSPAVSVVYSEQENQVFRASFSSAIRNPTLADQYLYYNVGRAILLGNLNGIDSLVTVESLYTYFNTLKGDSLEYFNIPPIQPEQVKTIEVGYRGTLLQHLFIDAEYYYSFYKHFIGYKIGVDVDYNKFFNSLTVNNAYRVAANATEQVTTQGFSVGFDYFFNGFYSISGNYSYNSLVKASNDPIIPAYNTPLNKFNIGISGRDIRTNIGKLSLSHWGFFINYKWIQGFQFEGSPQFTGFVPTYGLLDAQINHFFPKIYMTVKVGASNLLNNKHYEVYGGPLVGRLAYISAVFDIDQRHLEEKK